MVYWLPAKTLLNLMEFTKVSLEKEVGLDFTTLMSLILLISSSLYMEGHFIMHVLCEATQCQELEVCLYAWHLFLHMTGSSSSATQSFQDHESVLPACTYNLTWVLPSLLQESDYNLPFMADHKVSLEVALWWGSAAGNRVLVNTLWWRARPHFRSSRGL